MADKAAYVTDYRGRVAAWVSYETFGETKYLLAVPCGCRDAHHGFHKAEGGTLKPEDLKIFGSVVYDFTAYPDITAAMRAIEADAQTRSAV